VFVDSDFCNSRPCNLRAISKLLFRNLIVPVDGNSGKYPEFKGNVATMYSQPMAQGGSGNGHYGKKAEVYMDVGEAMGQAMMKLLQGTK
jgi:hypothetical protein